MTGAVADVVPTAPHALTRAPRESLAGRRGADARSPWMRRLLGVPLTAKLAGANLFVLLLAVAGLVLAAGRPDHLDVWIVGGALALGLIVNSLLVRYALRPVWELERVASRVWAGDFGARVPGSAVADREMTRVGRTFNLLLDSLATDRERMRTLAMQAVRAQDDERSRIARELHDSTAQNIAALTYQLAAAARQAGESGQPELEATLRELREQTGELLEEVRLLSHAIHPRVLDDLGLVPALEWLARRTREHTALEVQVDADLPGDPADMSDATAAALYRVAQESLRNVERHARAHVARVTLRAEADDVILEVVDDGRGFDVAEAEARRPGMGLFSMRERLGLVGGSFEISTAAGRGTRVRARAPRDSFAPRHTVPFSPPASELR
ncbi:histidine kinase [Roseisolibacter agri]|uniref:histidine kinase n=1 Tax=Roseisolibacter agri TaxID=2014610 RepID=A0AA37Q7L4_9BACT|nr:histidine kinase [Roseisolibacter agri]